MNLLYFPDDMVSKAFEDRAADTQESDEDIDR